MLIQYNMLFCHLKIICYSLLIANIVMPGQRHNMWTCLCFAWYCFSCDMETMKAKRILWSSSNTGKTPCKYEPVFAPYLHDWTLYSINTVQNRVRIYMAFILCNVCIGRSKCNYLWIASCLGVVVDNLIPINPISQPLLPYCKISLLNSLTTAQNTIS